MMKARQVVEDIARSGPALQDLPEALRPVVERHFENLTQLVLSLQAAGREPEVIRELITTLLKSYGADLTAALEAQK